MNYIDEIAVRVGERAGLDVTGVHGELSRLYALLVLVTGENTTNEHVHDAWALWMCSRDHGHRSLVPFRELTSDVQALDTPYRDAIVAVARERGLR